MFFLAHFYTFLSLFTEMDPSQATPGNNISAYGIPPYSHSQPFLCEDAQGQKRLISPDLQLGQYHQDKRLRHNSLDYMLDFNSQPIQSTFIRKIRLENPMKGIDSLTMTAVRRDNIRDLATKQDLANLESSVKAQSMELRGMVTYWCCHL